MNNRKTFAVQMNDYCRQNILKSCDKMDNFIKYVKHHLSNVHIYSTQQMSVRTFPAILMQ